MGDILDILSKRLDEFIERTNERPEYLSVTRDELLAYIQRHDELRPTFQTDDAGVVIPLIGTIPLHCSFRGVPLRCYDAS